MTADLVVIVAQTLRMAIRGGVEQEAGGFDRAARDDNDFGGSALGFAVEKVSDAGGAAMCARSRCAGRSRWRSSGNVRFRARGDHGRATGVAYFLDGETKRATAKVIVVSCGAIESARLLLNSASDRHPQGLGNDHDQVGRHLQGHYYPAAYGILPDPVHTPEGHCPGVSIATCQWNHHNKGIVGGGALCNEFIKTPILYMKWAWPPDVPRWGIEAKRFARKNYSRTVQLTGPVQEIPSPDARVTVDPKVADAWNVPVARLSGSTHPETVRTAEFIRKQAGRWLRASGATRIWGKKVPLCLSAGQHHPALAGWAPIQKPAVTDSFGRIHGHDNLFVCDGSFTSPMAASTPS